jgi:hypothetical protein
MLILFHATQFLPLPATRRAPSLGPRCPERRSGGVAAARVPGGEAGRIAAVYSLTLQESQGRLALIRSATILKSIHI